MYNMWTPDARKRLLLWDVQNVIYDIGKRKMTCELCKERGKDWDGGDPECAFEDGVFSPNNWNCATMNKLRELAEERETEYIETIDDAYACSFEKYHYIDDQYLGVIPYKGIADIPKFVVIGWYKNRGQTEEAVVFGDNGITTLTLNDAEDAVWYHERGQRYKTRGSIYETDR